MQGVLVFAGTAARGSAIGTAVEGQFAFLKDTDTLTYYSGTAWEELSSTSSAAVVSATSGTPTLGTVTSGGDTFNIYSYTGDGSITFSSAGTVDVVDVVCWWVVAVLGAFGVAGGGGAGWHLVLLARYLPAGTATRCRGCRWSGRLVDANAGNNGQDGGVSTIANYVALGGGGGAGTTGRTNTTNNFFSNVPGSGGFGWWRSVWKQC